MLRRANGRKKEREQNLVDGEKSGPTLINLELESIVALNMLWL